MIELPEAYVLSEQINQTLVGKTVMNVTANAHPHAFAWYTGNPNTYHEKLYGKKIISSNHLKTKPIHYMGNFSLHDLNCFLFKI